VLADEVGRRGAGEVVLLVLRHYGLEGEAELLEDRASLRARRGEKQGGDSRGAHAGDHILVQLSAALDELGARIVLEDAPPDIDISLDAATIATFSPLATSTPYGRLDIVLVPTGTRGYDDLARAATREVLTEGGLVVSVAALADVIRSKAAAGRTKDHAQLPILREALEQSRRLES